MKDQGLLKRCWGCHDLPDREPIRARKQGREGVNADLMRRIDRWVGVPACFVLSAFRRLIGGTPLRSKDKPKRILFIGLAEIGAMVVAYPAVAYARRLFPDAELYFLSFDAGRPMLR